jgi:DNA-binding NarL/FixJ family response regulator
MPNVAPSATLSVLDPEVADRLTDIRAHAAECGRLDCGHLARSTSRAVRRAVILYTAEGAGITVDLSHETPEVSAVLGVLRESGHARPVFVRNGRRYEQSRAGMVVLPNAAGIRITPERLAVFTAMLSGMSASEVARAQGRARATVQSHAGYLRRLTGGHDATSCLVALVLAHKLSDRAMPVPAEEEEDTDSE